MITVQTEIAEKVACVCCGSQKYATQSPYLCHNCWKNGEAAQMIQRLTKRAADGARFCPECHALLEEHSVYCDTCGTDTPRR